MAQPFRAPLDAIATSIPITPVQGATIVAEISGKLERWIANKNPTDILVPSLTDVSILQGGSVWWCRGQTVSSARAVAMLGSLLSALLDQTARHRIPAGLLYVLARASDPRHLAPFADLGEFHRTLSRYAAARPAVALDALVARFAVASSGLPPLGGRSTISDVRRLRRAGGVPLAQIALDTAIPISLLRELEWGVYTYWNIELARDAVELYAERAGLDSDAVVRVIEHEQALAVREPAPADLVANGTSEVLAPADRRVMPFALAGLLIGAVLLAPGDRPAQVVRSATVAHDSAPAARPPVPVPTSAHPETTGARPPIAPAINPLPRRSRATAVQRGRVRPEKPRHPLVRLARAIAGDGHYKVEPFPKVQ
jgi:hypothetical protein